MIEYSYGAMVASWGYEILDMEPFGEYHGDYAVLLQDGNRYGWLTFGYGSCSGCDTMEYLDYGGGTEKEYIEFAEQVRNEIKWDSARGLADWLSDTEIQEGKYSWHEDGYPEYVKAAVEKLRAR